MKTHHDIHQKAHPRRHGRAAFLLFCCLSMVLAYGVYVAECAITTDNNVVTGKPAGVDGTPGAPGMAIHENSRVAGRWAAFGHDGAYAYAGAGGNGITMVGDLDIAGTLSTYGGNGGFHFSSGGNGLFIHGGIANRGTLHAYGGNGAYGNGGSGITATGNVFNTGFIDLHGGEGGSGADISGGRGLLLFGFLRNLGNVSVTGGRGGTGPGAFGGQGVFGMGALENFGSFTARGGNGGTGVHALGGDGARVGSLTNYGSLQTTGGSGGSGANSTGGDGMLIIDSFVNYGRLVASAGYSGTGSGGGNGLEVLAPAINFGTIITLGSAGGPISGVSGYGFMAEGFTNHGTLLLGPGTGQGAMYAFLSSPSSHLLFASGARLLLGSGSMAVHSNSDVTIEQGAEVLAMGTAWLLPGAEYQTLYSDFFTIESPGMGTIAGMFTPAASAVLDYQVTKSPADKTLSLHARRNAWASSAIGEKRSEGRFTASLEQALRTGAVSAENLRWHNMLVEIEHQPTYAAVSKKASQLLRYNTPQSSVRMLSMLYRVSEHMAGAFADSLRETSMASRGGRPCQESEGPRTAGNLVPLQGKTRGINRWMWLEPVYSSSREGARGSLPSQRYATQGIQAGYAFVNSAISMGFGAYQAVTNASGDPLDARSESYGAQFGARILFPRRGVLPWLESSVGYGRHNVRIQRTDTYNNHIESRAGASSVHAAIAVGVDIAPAGKVTVSPSVGITHAIINMEDYHEFSEDILAPVYGVKAKTFDNTRGNVSITVKGLLTSWAALSGSVGYSRSLDGKTPSLSATGMGLPEFRNTFVNETYPKETVSLGAALNIGHIGAVRFFLGYKGSFADSYNSHGVACSMSTAF